MLSPHAHFWATIAAFTVFLIGLAVFLALARRQPPPDDDADSEDAGSTPGDMRLAA